MSRYIDADELIEILKAKSKTDYEMGLYNHGALTDSFIRFVGRYPPADVVEIRRAHWVVCGAFDDFLKCSSCGYDRPWQTAIEHKYCPECGAKMKGECDEQR